MKLFSDLKNTIASLPDRSLVKQAQQGDREAFGRLYLKYLDGIYRYMYFRVNYHVEEAEDLTEQVFFKAWQSLEKFVINKGTFKAWLYRIAHNYLADYHRSRSKHQSVELKEQVADQPDLVGEIWRREQSRSLLAAMGQLSEEQQQVVSLRFVEGMTHGEIGQVLGKKEEAVRAMQYRALKRLREELEEEKYE
jgi:RNA polymerase sigma-70 factor (ECF subfamily)